MKMRNGTDHTVKVGLMTKLNDMKVKPSEVKVLMTNRDDHNVDEETIEIRTSKNDHTVKMKIEHTVICRENGKTNENCVQNLYEELALKISDMIIVSSTSCSSVVRALVCQPSGPGSNPGGFVRVSYYKG